MTKTALGLVEYAKAQLGKPYWYGAFGQAASKDIYNMYKGMYPSNYKWDFTPEVVGQKVHDCVGLIKGYLWCDNPKDTTPKYNSKQDKSADMMRDVCTITGSISSIPEIPGMLVFLNGHVGVYIGNGEVIEARGHAYGVVKTKLANRSWKVWGRCPYIEYEGVILHRGMKNNDVKVMQEKLISLKYDLGSSGADGSYGGATERAVTKFQNDHGITPTGVFNDVTSKALEKALTPAPTAPKEPIKAEKPTTQEPAPIDPPLTNPVEPPRVGENKDNEVKQPPEIKEDPKVEDDKTTSDIDDKNATLLSKVLGLLIELLSKLLGKNK